MDLSEKKCVPCAKGTSPLKGPALKAYEQGISPGWTIINEHHLSREFLFKNFQQALDFTHEVGVLAEQENHHPDIHLSWGKVNVELWTHKIDGLSENDFILAAKIDLLLN